MEKGYEIVMRQLLKIVFGAIMGVIIGLWASSAELDWVVRILTTIQSLIGQLITFTIPLIIFFFISSGISSLKHGGGALLGKTVGLAYLSTILAATMAYFIAAPLIPDLVGSAVPLSITEQKTFAPFIELGVPPLMNVMTALVLSFIVGLSIYSFQLKVMKQFVEEGKQTVDAFLKKVIIPLLPYFIAGEFCRIAAEGQAFVIAKTFLGVLFTVVCLHFLWLSVLYIAACLRAKVSPFFIMKTMFPAYLTALGTMSSAATIPVTLRQTKKLGVEPALADFTIPLCANIHISGSAITVSTCALALMAMTNHSLDPSFAEYFPFILMLGVVMVAAPGAPGGAILAALGILQSMLGFSDDQCALMIALYLAQDSFGTACNVSGDGALTLILSKSKKLEKRV